VTAGRGVEGRWLPDDTFQGVAFEGREFGISAFALQCVSQGFCAGLEFKANLEKSLNFIKLKMILNCFRKRTESLEKFGICLS